MKKEPIEFSTLFSQYLPTEIYKSECLKEEPLYINTCFNMLAFAFPKAKPEFINTLLLGGGQYKLGGINSMYGDCAVHKVYDTVLHWLKTGHWLMGLDKCTISSYDLRLKGKMQLYSKVNNEERLTTYYENDNIVFACSEANWYYTGVIIKNYKTLKAFVKKMTKTNGETFFENIYIACDGFEFIGNSFSSAKVEELL